MAQTNDLKIKVILGLIICQIKKPVDVSILRLKLTSLTLPVRDYLVRVGLRSEEKLAGRLIS